MYDNVIIPAKEGKTEHCWRCGRVLYEDPRGHIGCLNTKCRGYLSGAKRYSKEELKQFKRKQRETLWGGGKTQDNQYKWRNKTK